MSSTPSPQVVYVQPPSNGLGVAAFVCSLVGVLSCGLFAPVGLALSIPAMFRQPRGFALAGLILGIAGSLWLLAAFVLFGGVLAVLVALLAVLGVQFAAYGEMARITVAIERYEQRAGSLPADLSAVAGLDHDDLTDPWGHAYRYVLGADGKSYELRSDGPDGKPGTVDDVVQHHSSATVEVAPPPSR